MAEMLKALLFLVALGLLVYWVFTSGKSQARRIKMRQDGLIALAARLGLQFEPMPNYDLAKALRSLDALSRGDNRYAYNIMSGVYSGHSVRAFDFYYQSHSSGSRGRVTVHEHHSSHFVLQLPKTFPELIISPRNVLSKFAHALGFVEVELDSREFSRRFRVRSEDKQFARDVCSIRMIQYLLSQPPLRIEIDGPMLALCNSELLSPEQFELNLNRLTRIRALLPNHLFVNI